MWFEKETTKTHPNTSTSSLERALQYSLPGMAWQVAFLACAILASANAEGQEASEQTRVVGGHPVES